MKNVIRSIRFLLFVCFFYTVSLNAIELSREEFNNNDDGWSGGSYDSVRDKYSIPRNGTGAEDYNFNASYGLKNVVIEFDVDVVGGWELVDTLNVTANGVATQFHQTDGTYHYSVNALLDSGGDLQLRINPATSSNDEFIRIDNVVITFVSAIANNDSYSMVKNTTLNGFVLTNDIGPGISVVSNGSPSHGTLSIASNGSFTYTPTTNYMGTDSFTYEIRDSNGYESTATVYITITDTATAGYRDFTLRKQLYTRGNMKTIGNTVIVPPTGSDTTNYCASYTNGSFISDASSANNNYYLCGYLSDTATVGLTNATTAELNIPAGSEVIWAGLYWQSIVANASWNSNMTIKLRKDGAGYVDISPTRVDYGVDAGRTGYTSYSAFADVTSYFGAGRWNEGNYTVANIPVYEGMIDSLGSYGAWTLVAIYADTVTPNEKFRSFSVFDGWKKVSSSDPEVNVTVSGFYTPDQPSITAKLSVFAAEGDKHIQNDHLYTINYNNNSQVTLEPVANNSFNSSISGGDYRLPNLINNNGIDIQTYNIGSYMIPQQTSMFFKFTSNQDTYWPSLLAFSTELFTPHFCYDYGYEQNGLPFTETNPGTNMPRITGILPNTADINVSLYIRNMEASDIVATNVKMNINNIDASQAIYKRNTVDVTFPNEYIPQHYSDAAWPINVSDTYIRNIPMGSIHGSEYAYVYYGLTPQSIGDINMSIDATFSYDLQVPLPNGNTLTFPSSSTLGGATLPMCSADNFGYTPQWGIFSVVDAGLYDAATANRYYDLTTQVAKRPGNLRVASFNPVNLDTPEGVSTIVAVEMIDASQFHDVDAACQEPSSSITPRVWVYFENNVTQVNFNEATINNAIANGAVSDAITLQPVTLANAADFYKNATPNAAFRVTYNVLNDQNESLIHIVPTTHGIRIDNFSDIHQIYPHCRKPVKNPNNNTLTDLTSVACSNNGNNSTYEDVAICMECLYGADTKVLCSRDNFAIRPESYTVTLKDINQTNPAQVLSFAPNRTGVVAASLVSDQVQMASGYNYLYDINATNHVDNGATPGYTRYFGTQNDEFNISLLWNPSTPKTGCNDTASKTQNFNLINGVVSAEGNLSQAGEYLLDIIDKSWTAVDWDSSMQAHQTGSHFLGGPECVLNSATVPLKSSVISLSGTTINNRVGCDISSVHDQLEAPTTANPYKYRNYNLQFHPYKFDMSAINFGLGTQPTEINATVGSGFLYMADIDDNDSMNMSVRATGPIVARGYDGIALSNFVGDCYAKPVNISMVNDANLTIPNVPYQFRFMDMNSSGDIIYDTQAVAVSAALLGSVGDGNFTKDNMGALSTVTRFNFDRNVTLPVNPQSVWYDGMMTACSTPAECRMQADLIATHEAVGDRNMDFNVTHMYGRFMPRDIRIFGSVPFSANGWYEVYDSTRALGATLPRSKFEGDWYTNITHEDENFGDSSVTVINPSLPNNTPPMTFNMPVAPNNGIETYSFSAIGDANIPYNGKAHVDTAPWLWYGINVLDYLDPAAGNQNCLTHPCFNISVVPAVGATGSAKDNASDSKASKKSDQGTGWRSTSDYSPAIR